MPKVDLREQRRAERAARRKRNTILASIAGIVVLAVIVIFIFQGQSNRLGADEVVDTVFPLSEDAIKTSSGLIIDYLADGEGPEAKAGDTVAIIYTGYLPDGQIFDSNVETGEYFEFVLGAGEAIAGWDEGIEGMQVGGARLLVIPPDLAVGVIDPFQAIPENTTLTFSITLKEIK
jgi:FKBP-type peptidyl-prolyl cis-trans isomerase FkpA